MVLEYKIAFCSECGLQYEDDQYNPEFQCGGCGSYACKKCREDWLEYLCSECQRDKNQEAFEEFGDMFGDDDF